jgi:hypothetical protein
LEPVTHAENVRRGDSGKYLIARTNCPKGHKYSKDNTYYLKKRTNRYCRTCRRNQMAARRLRDKELNVA